MHKYDFVRMTLFSAQSKVLRESSTDVLQGMVETTHSGCHAGDWSVYKRNDKYYVYSDDHRLEMTS